MTFTNDSFPSEAMTSPNSVSHVAAQRLGVRQDIDNVKENAPPSRQVVKRRKTARGEKDHSSSLRLQRQEPLVSILRPCMSSEATTKFPDVAYDYSVPLKRSARVCPSIGERVKITRVRFEAQSQVRVMPSRRDLSKEERERMYMSATEIMLNANRNRREYLSDGCVMERATEEEGFVETTRGLVHPATFAHLREQDTCRQRIVALLEQMWQGGSACSAGEWSEDDNCIENDFENFDDDDKGDDINNVYSVFPLAGTGKIMNNDEIGDISHLGNPCLRRGPPLDFSGFQLEIEDLEDQNTEYHGIHNWETACA
jgi:hypothetical protein